jgi:hypothetical protein
MKSEEAEGGLNEVEGAYTKQIRLMQQITNRTAAHYTAIANLIPHR